MARTNEHDQPVGDPVPGWEPRPRPTATRLVGASIAVEPLTAAHVPDLFAALCAAGDDPLWTYRPTPRPASPDELVAIVATLLAQPTWVTFALVPADGGAAGIASYTRIDEATGQVEVAGILLARSLQRTRPATEALHLMIRHAFDDLGYRRVEWKCDSLNEPSRRAAARLGFGYEGRFRNHMVVQGRSRDTDWFSITDGEWPALRAAHERWLAPDTFDDDGRQRLSLRDLTAPLRHDVVSPA